MPPSPAMRCSPGRELRGESHRRGRSLESGSLYKEKDDDLALFNEVQDKERENFLLQSNDDFEDIFSTKLRYFSDHKLGISVPARGESSDLLNTEGDKNDYEWLITPPETPLFPSLDDETRPVNLAQRGRPRSQPVSISRSSTMEKNYRSSRGSPSPNRLSPSPRSGSSTFQSRGRPSSAPHSSPPPSLRQATPSRRPSPPPPPSKMSTPARRSSTPTPRRMSTGSSGTAAPSRVRGTSPIKTSRGNSSSPKIRAWQSNIPGFSLEAPPNLRTSLADRPASYVRGSSPASRNGSRSGRQSMSPTASRSSSYSHDRDPISTRSKGSVASSGDDDADSLQSIPASSSDYTISRSMGASPSSRGLSFSKKPTRVVSSSSAPKRSFDVALRQMDHRKAPQNMFRPLLSSVPSSTFCVGKASVAHRSMISRNSSITTSSNASSDQGTSGALDSEENEQNQDVTSESVKGQYPDIQDEIFVLDQIDALHEDAGNKIINEAAGTWHTEVNEHSVVDSHLVGAVSSSQHDTAVAITASPVVTDTRSDHLGDDCREDLEVCSKCSRRFPITKLMEGDLKLCPDCQNLEVSSPVSSQPIVVMVGENTSGDTVNVLEHGPVAMESSELIPKPFQVTDVGDTGVGQLENIACEGQVSDGEPSCNFLAGVSLAQPMEEESNLSITNKQTDYQPTAGDTSYQQQHKEFSSSQVDVPEGAGISVLLKRSNSTRGHIVRNKSFTATNITYDDLSYVRDSTNSMRSSIGHGSNSVSSSVDLGSNRQIETRIQRQLSGKKCDSDYFRYEVPVKHKRSVSSLSGASSNAFQVVSLTTSSHEDSFEMVVAYPEKEFTEETLLASSEPQLASECTEAESTCTDIGNNNNLSATFVFSSHEVNGDLVESSVPSVLNFEESNSHENGENKLNNSNYSLNMDASSTPPENHTPVGDPVEHSCADGVDIIEVPNWSSLDAISELEIENYDVHSHDSLSDNDTTDSKSSMNELQDSSIPEGSNHVLMSVAEAGMSDHVPDILEESTVLMDDKGLKARSLTLEEATDTILFCSSIVHNLAYEAANIAIEKENSFQLEGSRPTVTLVGKSNLDRREMRSRTMGKRASKSQKARQKRLDVENKPPSSNSEIGEKTDVPTTQIVGAPNKGDSMGPPKLESKCNCTIM